MKIHNGNAFLRALRLNFYDLKIYFCLHKLSTKKLWLVSCFKRSTRELSLWRVCLKIYSFTTCSLMKIEIVINIYSFDIKTIWSIEAFPTIVFFLYLHNACKIGFHIFNTTDAIFKCYFCCHFYGFRIVHITWAS